MFLETTSRTRLTPVFGLGGFIIPVDRVRQLSGAFRHIKELGLKEEINSKVIDRGKNLDHWEKKGSSLLTTQNVEKYREVRRIIGRVLTKLEELGAQVVFYGQEKPRGGPDLVSETNAERYDHTIAIVEANFEAKNSSTCYTCAGSSVRWDGWVSAGITR